MLYSLAVAVMFAAETVSVTDGEVWNEGVDYYRAGDVTNALRVLRPLMVSKTHAARAAEVVAKLEHERGNLEEAAAAAQIALRENPDDAKANRNFTRAVDRLPDVRDMNHVNEVLKAAEGKDPSAMLRGALAEARKVMAESGGYRTNAAPRAVALSDSLSRRMEKMADVWLPVREMISNAVTNEQQSATILQQVEQAQKKSLKAAKELSDLSADAYGTMSDVEHDATRFYKLVVLPPPAMDEDLVCQSNAWLDVEAFNGRDWQQDALDYTRAFRTKFPAWARAYEQQAQSDTNKPPFAAEAQAQVSALATELEKIQLACIEKVVASEQQKAIGIIEEIRKLLPKDKDGGGQNDQPDQQQNPNQDQQKQEPQKQDQQNQDQDPDQQQDQDPQQDEQKDESQGQEPQEPEEDREIEDILKKAQERNDEHEADKKARMRKAPLPPNERDW